MNRIRKFVALLLVTVIASTFMIIIPSNSVNASLSPSDIHLSPGTPKTIDVGYSLPIDITYIGITPCIDLLVCNRSYMSSTRILYSETIESASFVNISSVSYLNSSNTFRDAVGLRLDSTNIKAEYFDDEGNLIPGFYNITFYSDGGNYSSFYEVTGNPDDGVYDGSYDATITLTPNMGTSYTGDYVYGFAKSITASVTGYDGAKNYSLYYYDSSTRIRKLVCGKSNETKNEVTFPATWASSEYVNEYGEFISGRYILECRDSHDGFIASSSIQLTGKADDGSYARYPSSSLEITIGEDYEMNTPSGNQMIKTIGITSRITAEANIVGYSGNHIWQVYYLPFNNDNDYQWGREYIISTSNNSTSASLISARASGYEYGDNYNPGMYRIVCKNAEGFEIASAMIRITGDEDDGIYPTPSPIDTPTQTEPAPQPETPTIETTPPAQTPAVTPVVTPAVTTPTPSANASESGTAGFVERLYTIALGRSSEPAGKANWIKALQTGSTGAEAAKGFLFSDEFLNKSMSDRAFVTTLYRTFFDREPDAAGLTAWIDALKNGTSKEDVIMGFIDSTEWANVCLKYGIPSGGNGVANITVEPNENIVAFATRLYTTCMKRDPDQSGLMAWARQLANLKDTGTNAAHGFFFSEEFLAQDISDSEFVTRLYLTFMGRNPDYGGKKAWVEQLQAGVSREEVFQGFAQSDEFGNICAQYGIIR